jgi:hypothetical protein
MLHAACPPQAEPFCCPVEAHPDFGFELLSGERCLGRRCPGRGLSGHWCDRGQRRQTALSDRSSDSFLMKPVNLAFRYTLGSRSALRRSCRSILSVTGTAEPARICRWPTTRQTRNPRLSQVTHHMDTEAFAVGAIADMAVIVVAWHVAVSGIPEGAPVVEVIGLAGEFGFDAVEHDSLFRCWMQSCCRNCRGSASGALPILRRCRSPFLVE